MFIIYLSKGKLGYDVIDDEIFTLYREVNKFALASHFYWGIWALVNR